MIYFIVPETYGPVLLQWKARELRKADPVGNKDVYAEHEREDWSIKGVIYRTVFRLVEMVLKEKILISVTVYISFVYGILYSRECFWPPSASLQLIRIPKYLRPYQSFSSKGGTLPTDN